MLNHNTTNYKALITGYSLNGDEQINTTIETVREMKMLTSWKK